jgi:hypothetical protein
MRDAELGYGLAVDTLSYLSRMQAAALRRKAATVAELPPGRSGRLLTAGILFENPPILCLVGCNR